MDTLQGIGAIDEENRRATSLGGTESDVALDLSGLDPAVFGDRVDVEVREIALAGAEGLADTPRVVAAMDGEALDGGALDVHVPTYDRYAGYQLIITPDQDRDVAATQAAQPWTASIEAEAMQLTAAQAYTQDPKAGGGWKFLASGGRGTSARSTRSARARSGPWRFPTTARTDCRSSAPGPAFRAVTPSSWMAGPPASSSTPPTWPSMPTTVAVPRQRGTARRPDGRIARALGRCQRRRPDPLAELLITLDKLSLNSVEEGEPTVYAASGYRLESGSTLDWDKNRGAAILAGDARADLYASALETGYHDLVVEWSSAAAANCRWT